MESVKTATPTITGSTTNYWRSGPAAGAKLPSPAQHRDVTDFFNGATSLRQHANGPGGNGPRPLNNLQLAVGRLFYRLEKAGENTWHAQNRLAESAGNMGGFVGMFAGSMVQGMIGSTIATMILGPGFIQSLGGAIAGFVIGGKIDRWLGDKIPFFGDRSRFGSLTGGLGAFIGETSVNVTLGGFAHPAMWVGKNAQKAIGYNPWRDPKRPRL